MLKNGLNLMSLYWDGTYAIVLALIEQHPNADVESIGIEQLFQMVIALPDFADEPEMANTRLLEAILWEWYEEVHP